MQYAGHIVLFSILHYKVWGVQYKMCSVQGAVCGVNYLVCILPVFSKLRLRCAVDSARKEF